ncbi:heterodisulfide reductase subunit B [Sulfobacillus thermosulfidooxidans DSM 9293]|uniref:Heterodisulfide reductase subunit B n=1 Tax=Sulfobacillus thermosulfidooxidans (strain DSM 9293 / VKM B-1269 / AT-1) TaxID=929705 RepID=A0A1W1WAY9_SULTA|nr:CoB--CoM heterodisulfide reductase iron-sulfur subunit B family protein [Sulfobacillus thermosulfidooxidans]SMC03319.1 heterodisulfide reductase subunit B [Sulfobacillus thermosulfidooxidans DSM 9293]
MKTAYFPGCSLKTIDRAYDVSTRVIAKDLGMTLVEVEDYSCCGAGELKGEGVKSHFLPARNLAHLLHQGETEVMVSCNVCYHELSRTAYTFEVGGAVRDEIQNMLNEAGEPPLTEKPSVRNTLEYLVNVVGLDTIAQHVRVPLTGLRVAPYYGCLYHRPGNMLSSVQIAGEDTEHPHFMHDLLKTLGATVVSHPAETTCCGGKNLLSDGRTSGKLTGRILSKAKSSGADVLALMCPKCAGGLDALQPRAIDAVGEGAKLPVMYYTQLVGIAFGHRPEELYVGDMESDALSLIEQFLSQAEYSLPTH